MAAAKKNIRVLRLLEQYGGDSVDWRVLTPRGESVVDVARLVGASSEFVVLLERIYDGREGSEDYFWDAEEYM